MTRTKSALFTMTAIVMSAAMPFSVFAAPEQNDDVIYVLCDFHECCYVDSGGNGYCVPTNTQA